MEYGDGRLAELLGGTRGQAPRDLAAACRADLARFLEGSRPADDLTLMVLRQEADV